MFRSTFFLSVALQSICGAIANASEISGTRLDLECVYQNLDALSLDGLLDPVRPDIAGCRDLFASPVATDKTHSGLSEPDLDIEETAQPFLERAELSIEQIERIPCMLEDWLVTNPDAESDTVITLNLDTECSQ
jgi:hypothetical protein